MIWENAHDKMLNFKKVEVKVYDPHDFYQSHTYLLRKRLKENTQEFAAVILGSGEVMSNMYLYLCFSIFLKDSSMYKKCFYNKNNNKTKYIWVNVL